jgi:hypothetical protein
VNAHAESLSPQVTADGPTWSLSAQTLLARTRAEWVRRVFVRAGLAGVAIAIACAEAFVTTIALSENANSHIAARRRSSKVTPAATAATSAMSVATTNHDGCAA